MTSLNPSLLLYESEILMGNSFAIVVSILVDNDSKALNVVPGEISLKHGGLAEDEDQDCKLDYRAVSVHTHCVQGYPIPTTQEDGNMCVLASWHLSCVGWCKGHLRRLLWVLSEADSLPFFMIHIYHIVVSIRKQALKIPRLLRHPPCSKPIRTMTC